MSFFKSIKLVSIAIFLALSITLLYEGLKYLKGSHKDFLLKYFSINL